MHRDADNPATARLPEMQARRTAVAQRSVKVTCRVWAAEEDGSTKGDEDEQEDGEEKDAK